jgi:hypothetical protein
MRRILRGTFDRRFCKPLNLGPLLSFLKFTFLRQNAQPGREGMKDKGIHQQVFRTMPYIKLGKKRVIWGTANRRPT